MTECSPEVIVEGILSLDNQKHCSLFYRWPLVLVVVVVVLLLPSLKLRSLKKVCLTIKSFAFCCYNGV